jgi:hypothetical protein
MRVYVGGKTLALVLLLGAPAVVLKETLLVRIYLFNNTPSSMGVFELQDGTGD